MVFGKFGWISDSYNWAIVFKATTNQSYVTLGRPDTKPRNCSSRKLVPTFPYSFWSGKLVSTVICWPFVQKSSYWGSLSLFFSNYLLLLSFNSFLCTCIFPMGCRTIVSKRSKVGLWWSCELWFKWLFWRSLVLIAAMMVVTLVLRAAVDSDAEAAVLWCRNFPLNISCKAEYRLAYIKLPLYEGSNKIAL